MGSGGPADLPGLERLLPLGSTTSLGKPKAPLPAERLSGMAALPTV